MPDSHSDATLILGGGGFLGAHAVAAAVTSAQTSATFADPLGPAVIATSRNPLLAPKFSVPRDAAEWEPLDLQAPGELRTFLDEVQPTAVLNCLALSRALDCEAQPELALLLNKGVPAELAAWCAEHDARLVHVSTDMVFGGEDTPPAGFAEDGEPQPLSVYGRTKVEGERAVLSAYPKALVCRLPLLYGNSGGLNRGASDTLLALVEGGQVPTLFTDEWRTPLEVSNAAQALVELLAGSASGILHIAGPDRVNRYELGLATLIAMGFQQGAAESAVKPVESASIPTLGPRPRDLCLDSRRARALLETPLHGTAEGLWRAAR